MVCICLEPPSLHVDVYASQPVSLTQRTRCHLSLLACVSFAEALLPQHPRLLACWTSTFYSCWRTEVDEARLYQTEISHAHHLLMSCERHVPSFVFSWRARHPTEHASGSEPETQFDLRPCSLNLWLSELAHMLLALEQVSDRVYVHALHSRIVEVLGASTPLAHVALPHLESGRSSVHILHADHARRWPCHCSAVAAQSVRCPVEHVGVSCCSDSYTSRLPTDQSRPLGARTGQLRCRLVLFARHIARETTCQDNS